MSSTTRFAECLHNGKTTALDLVAWRSHTPTFWTLPSARAPGGNASPRNARSRARSTWLPRRPDEARGWRRATR